MKRLHYLLLICLVALSPVTYAGWNIPVTNFSVADYSAGTQNWQLLTTSNGWLYAANNYGLLEYDGSQWRIYGMYYGNLPRSIAALDDKAIFIGATYQTLQHHSVLDRSPNSQKLLLFYSPLLYEQIPSTKR